IGCEGLGMLQLNPRRPITTQRLVRLRQTNQRIDLLPARGRSLIARRSLCPALHRLFEIATLIGLAPVLHQLIDRIRLLRMSTSVKSYPETKKNTHDHSTRHDGTPFDVLGSEFWVLSFWNCES